MQRLTWLVLGFIGVSGCSGSTFSTSRGPLGDAAVETGGTPGAGGAKGTGGRVTGGAAGRGGAATGGAAGNGGGIGGSPGSGGLTTGGVTGTGASIGVGGGVVPPDAGAIRCTGTNPTFPTFDKGCTDDTNCALVQHMTSCCGDALKMAINHGEVARFNAAETICDLQYPGCGCASQGVTAEDGTMVPWGSESLIVAKCDNGMCRSMYSGKVFTCGDKTCTDLEYCSSFTGGPAGSPTNYSCVFLGGCTSCSCLPAATGCGCTTDQGFIRVSCAAP